MGWERIAGGLVGLATGDALGVPVEFVNRDILQQHPVEAMRGHEIHDQCQIVAAMCRINELDPGR